MSFLATLLPLAVVIFIIAAGVVLLNQQFRKNLYRQKLEQEQLRSRHQLELLRSSIAAQEEERKRIARDLHDELGAVLSITRMHLIQLEKRHHEDADTAPALENIRQLTETSLANMRRISHELMPLQLERLGLAEALETVAAQVNRTGGLHLSVNIPGVLPTLSWSPKLALYRMIMELINNTLKHAEATAVDITLTTEPGLICCRYTDNGKGLPATIAAPGLGHKNLEGRANALNGTVSIGNGESGGFCAVIKIPLQDE